VPSLRTDGLRSCALYADAWTNDARLCLANVAAAAAAGAVVLNRAEVTSLRLTGSRVTGAEVRVDGEVVAVEARAVVNAAGPWIDRIRRLENPAAGTSVRLSKGAHVLVPGGADWAAALTIPQDAVRVTFAVPWYGMLLLGTTETEHRDDAGPVDASPDDVGQIVAEAAKAIDPELVRPERVRAAFAGLRVLPAGEEDSASARRETVYTVGRGGMLSVAGGKLTTYRRIAIGALERLRDQLGLREVDASPWPLPGGTGLESTRLPASLDEEVRSHLLHIYGSRATQVVGVAANDATLLERLHPDGPDIAAQVVFAAREEWAHTVDDVVRRRTTLFSRGLADESVIRRVEDLLARIG